MTETDFTPNVPKVYSAIATVMAAIAKDGIGKGRKNEQQGYKFRGIDDVYNAMSSLIADAKLCILPRCTAREVTERASKSGGLLFYVVVTAEFDFVSAEDGSKHLVGPFYGEAMDSGDKATNKAMSAAYKYALMETFCIPTEGDNDADAKMHEVVQGAGEKLAQRFLAAHKAGFDGPLYDIHLEANHDSELYSSAWKLISAPVRREIKEAIEREKVARSNLPKEGNHLPANGRSW